MSMFDTLISQTVRRLQLQQDEAASDADLARLQKQVTDLSEAQLAAATTSTTNLQGINQMLRNTDHSHSVDTWFEAAPSGTDEKDECACVYAYPEIAPITIGDGAIGAGLAVFTSPSNPFTAAMVGRYVIIEGAGTAGADFSSYITAYTNAGSVTLFNNAVVGVSGAISRINLQKLTHVNSKNTPASTTNDALKDAAHADYALGIKDPDWMKSIGSARIGGDGVLAYPLGYFANNGTTYIPLNQLSPGREPHFRFNIARANPYVKFVGRIFVGLYNNSTEVLDWIKGANIAISSAVSPAPATTVSTEYMVAMDTGQGFTLVTSVATVAGAPDDAGFTAGTRVSLTWQYYAGVVETRVYRKRSGGNVFLMETFSTGSNSWTDVNLSTRTDTGLTTFPTFSDRQTAIPSYWATADGALDDITYNGEPKRYWEPILGRLAMNPTVNLAHVLDPHFIIGLTEPLATELKDVVTNSTTGISSVAAQFTAAMTGKAFTLTDPTGLHSVTGTLTYVSATTATLSTAATWTGTGSTLVIADSQPNGLYVDLVGLSLNGGEWEFHPDDNNRPQNVAANPNGSTQGSIGGTPGDNTGGTGGVRCVIDTAKVSVRGPMARYQRLKRWLRLDHAAKYTVIEKDAIDVELDDRVWNGIGYYATDFNEIDDIFVHTVDEIHLLMTKTAILPCTDSHRMVNGPKTFRHGVAVKNLSYGSKLLLSAKVSTNIESVVSVLRQPGKFRVVSFKLKAEPERRTAHLIVINDFICHNSKLETVPDN